MKTVDDLMGVVMALFLIGVSQLGFGFSGNPEWRVCRWTGAACLLGAVIALVAASVIQGSQT